MKLLTLRLIAVWTERKPETVRMWARRGTIKPKACDVQTRALLYDMADVPPERFHDTHPEP